jgi:O-methyltransferase
MRAAYLDLLKRSLCDLLGPQTETVIEEPGVGPIAHELPPERLSERLEGREWPLRGSTMVGLRRLDDLQQCVETLLKERIEGDLIEAGVWRGGASILMRATLDAYGASDRTVWLADSFSGLPDPDTEAYPEDVGMYLHIANYLAVPSEEVWANFERHGLRTGVEFVEGFFHETLPTLGDKRWALIRLDGDTYESTRIALESLYPGLAHSGFIIVDDYGAIEQCSRAVDDFRRERGIQARLEKVDYTCVRWRRDDKPLPTEEQEGPARPGRSLEPKRPRPPNVHMRTARERDLERHLAAIEGSRSWRLMAPARRVASALRRVRDGRRPG